MASASLLRRPGPDPCARIAGDRGPRHYPRRAGSRLTRVSDADDLTGPAVGLLFYAEPILTEDLDIFCHVESSGQLISLAPLYEHLQSRGYMPDGEFIVIEGVLVQFLIPPTDLVEEALTEAQDVEVEGVKTRVFQFEHLLAIMAETNRPRDRMKIAAALDCRNPNEERLAKILERYNLVNRWRNIVE